MADRATIRTGFPQEEFPGGRFTRAPDPRFGGNMARANEGAQYRGSPRYEHGAYLKGSPMHDAQYGNYVAPHRVDYTRNAPPQSSGTPNFRPPYGAPGKPSYNEWLQQIDPFHTGTYPPKKHPNPRMRGMGGGLGRFWNNLFNRAQGAEEVDETIKGPGFWEKMLGWTGDQLSPGRQEAKINLQDVQDRIGGDINWNKFFRDLDARGIDYAGNNTGIGSTNEYQMAYSPGDYYDNDDDYGPFIAPSVIEMDLEGIDYDPADEYDYDRKRGWPGHVWDSPPVYSARGGLI